VPSLLTLIWMLSLGLAAFAIVALASLVAARLIRQRDERADPDRRSRVSKALLLFAAKDGVRPKFNLSNRTERIAVLETALDALPFLRPQAKERLVDLLRDHGLDRRLRRQALCGNLRDQVAAMEALVLFPDEKTTALLDQMECSTDLRIWLEALRTRMLMGSGPDMMGLLIRVERPGARRAPIMQDLLLARAKHDIGEALSALQTELPPLTRALLLKVIGECQDPLALTPIKRALSSEDGAVRAAATEALGMLGLDAVGPALAQATRDSDWRVRLKACEAIGELGLWRQAKALAPLLHDQVWWVRLRAEEALERLGGMGRSVLDGSAAEIPAKKEPAKRRRSAKS
jgi:HEAT repeat protein